MLRKPPWSVEMLEKVTTSPFRLVMTQLWPFLATPRSEEHTSELQSRLHLVCRLLLEKKKIQHAGYGIGDPPDQCVYVPSLLRGDQLIRISRAMLTKGLTYTLCALRVCNSLHLTLDDF